MDRRGWIRSITLIAGLLALAVVVAQSRRNCEVPGSSYVPCVSIKILWKSLQNAKDGRSASADIVGPLLERSLG